ncbi:MAG: HlyD family secretion protein [Firmicutes bacterium]|nr:HlyD family secretion protein [Bacillota bacterium]
MEKKEVYKSPVRLATIILLILVIGGGWYGYNWYAGSTSGLSTDNASIENDHVLVSSKIMGRIRSLGADEGGRVEAGQIIVQLEDNDLRAQEAQAIAALNYAKKNLVLAKINLDRSQADLDRIKTLFESGNSTREQYEHAIKALETADAQYSIAKAQVDTANAQLGVIQTQLLNTKIAAPISGIIAKRAVKAGEVVQPSQAIFTINDPEHFWITANFEETKIRLIHPGQKVEINVDAYPNQKFQGRVDQVAAAIVPPPFSIGETTKTTQKIPVKILFDKIPEGVSLLAGMSAEVKIKLH